MDDVLRLQSNAEGKLPLTLVVLDEMQQYIGDDNDKALDGAEHRRGLLGPVREPGAVRRHRTERAHRHPDAAEADRPLHRPGRAVRQRRRDRRARGRASQEARARPSAQVGARRVSGEIDSPPRRHALRAAGGGQADLVPDYPVLPNRWRLWSEMLRAIDRAGKAGLRSVAARIIHGGVRAAARTDPSATSSAPTPLLRRQGARRHAQSGVLLREIDEFIQRMMSEGGDGELKARLCALIFLISQMSQPDARRRDRAASDGAVPRRSPRRGPG